MRDRIAIERLVHHTGWLIRLRWLAAVGMALATIAARYAFDINIGVVELLFLAAALGLFNFIYRLTYLHLMAAPPNQEALARTQRFAHLQILVDLLVLTAVLLYTGGARSPVAIFYVFHVILASILLSRRASYAYATFAATLFVALGVLEHVRSDLVQPLVEYDRLGVPLPWRVLFAEVLFLAVALYAVAYLAGTLATLLRNREEQLVAAFTSLNERSERLQEANATLAAIQERKESFLLHAAHQLKGPLAAIDACLSVVTEDVTTDPAKRKELLDRARSRIAQLFRLISDLLSLTMAREGVMPAGQSQLIDLNEIVTKVTEFHNVRADQKGVLMTVDAAADLPLLSGGERGLRDVVSNLVSNAIEYTPEGGTVKIKTFVEDGQVTLEVIDSGIGIPEGDLDKLFTEFFRAANARQVRAQGTGLGLVIVKETVERHGGTVAIDSLVNLGTCVRVALPGVANDPPRPVADLVKIGT